MAPGSPFGVSELPYGIFSVSGRAPSVGVAVVSLLLLSLLVLLLSLLLLPQPAATMAIARAPASIVISRLLKAGLL